MNAQLKLNDHLVEWNKFLLQEWQPALNEEATAKANFEYRFNLLKATLRINDPKIASAWADSIAFANDDVNVLNLEKRLAEAKVEALRKTLNYLEARADAIRSEVTSEREEAKLHSVNRFVP
jgi:hypothetical protein